MINRKNSFMRRGAQFMVHDFETARSEMIEKQLKTRDIKSVHVLGAMNNVPRHLFVPEELQSRAYDDSPLSIGFGATISQPYIVAYMTEQLAPFPGMKVLEIGTGSGYQAAVLAELGCEVYTIEFVEELAERARKVLAAFKNVKVRYGNGFDGWHENAPFDAIIVTAAPNHVPEKLIEQIKDGGKMIVPVGEIHAVQFLKMIEKKGSKITDKTLLPVRFVPMVEG
jgi:protein-L-isoaspartate(D-aspartate) O-methyltransferase